MAKFYGNVGYLATVETEPGVWTKIETIRDYYGDVIRNTKRSDGNQTVNDKITLSNTISIVADPFAYDNFSNMVWVEYMGVKWEVSSVEVQYPRLLLTVGGRYNETTS